MSACFRPLAVLHAAVALSVLAGSADAAFFSFASDSDPNGSSNWTFAGTAGSGGAFVLRQGPAAVPLDVRLLIDDNDGGLPTAALDVGFTADLRVSWDRTDTVGAFALHRYAVTGSFSFVDRVSGAALLTGLIGGGSAPGAQSAVMTVPGRADEWSTTGAVMGADTLGGVNAVTWVASQGLVDLAASQGVVLGRYGVLPGGSVGPDDFAFDLSFINAAGQAVHLDPATRLPVAAFNAESSFSGSYFGIPAPGPGALGVLGVLAATRRRHRASASLGGARGG